MQNVNSELQQLASITTKYSAVNSAAKGAKNQLQELRLELFEGLLTPEEAETLALAQRIVEKIQASTTMWNALEYHSSLGDIVILER
jgi:hypothetical protein